MAKLSVIIPTFNEEAFLEDALFSVVFADEIIVIDSFSTDATPEIAKKYATKFLQRKFDNFSNQKNHNAFIKSFYIKKFPNLLKF